MLTAIAIIWVLIWALVLVDLFQGSWSTRRKVLWAVGILIFPVVGVIAYLIVRPPRASDVAGGIASSDSNEEREERDPTVTRPEPPERPGRGLRGSPPLRSSTVAVRQTGSQRTWTLQ